MEHIEKNTSRFLMWKLLKLLLNKINFTDILPIYISKFHIKIFISQQSHHSNVTFVPPRGYAVPDSVVHTFTSACTTLYEVLKCVPDVFVIDENWMWPNWDYVKDDQWDWTYGRCQAPNQYITCLSALCSVCLVLVSFDVLSDFSYFCILVLNESCPWY